MNAVLDASSFLPLLLDTSANLALLPFGSVTHAYAPDLLLPEVGNALWKYHRSGTAVPSAREVLTLLERCDVQLIEGSAILERAYALACELDHPVYDCMYVAVALRHNAKLFTFDKRLAGRLRSSAYERLVTFQSKR